MTRAGIRAAIERVGLLGWFVAIDVLWIAKPEVLGIDARHYQRAADAWLTGGDPWSVTEGGITYAAAPHTLLFYAPTHLLPLAWSTWLWLLIGVAAALFVVRRLGLPMWWFLFPPLAHATWNGNPQNLAMALLLVGASPAARAALASVAVAIKLYAA